MEALDTTRRLTSLNSGNVCIPITNGAFHALCEVDRDEIAQNPSSTSNLIMKLKDEVADTSFACLREPNLGKRSLENPRTRLIKHLEEMLQRKLDDELYEEVPSSWQMIGDVVVLLDSAFKSPVWFSQGQHQLWEVVAKVLGVSRVAVGQTILPDGFRTPKLQLVLGEHGWVQHKENGVIYVLDVTRSMFASGNTSERARVGTFDCCGEVVVDLYAGVGYFTLPYLVHAKASLVHACEWSHYSVEGLKRGLAANKVEGKCVVHYGDNRKVSHLHVCVDANVKNFQPPLVHVIVVCCYKITCTCRSTLTRGMFTIGSVTVFFVGVSHWCSRQGQLGPYTIQQGRLVNCVQGTEA